MAGGREQRSIANNGAVFRPIPQQLLPRLQQLISRVSRPRRIAVEVGQLQLADLIRYRVRLRAQSFAVLRMPCGTASTFIRLHTAEMLMSLKGPPRGAQKT